MAKKKDELEEINERSKKTQLDFEFDDLLNQNDSLDNDKKEIEIVPNEAVVLTQEQKNILLREEIKKQNRGSAYEAEANSDRKKATKKELDKQNKKSRKIGSVAATIVSVIATIITYILLFFIMDGDVGKIIILGLFVLMPMEMIAVVCAVSVLITNLVLLFTGKFSWLILFNFLISIVLLAADVFVILAGAQGLFG